MENDPDLTYAGGKLRLFVEQPLGEGLRVAPGEGQAHYLLTVMRARAGDRVRLFNGRDGEWLARVAEVSKRACILVCERLTAEQSPVPDLWLAFAPIKKTPADYVVQKATELGVRALLPVMTRRTIVSRVNVDRMRSNAVEAAEQSDRLSVPEVRAPQPLPAFLSQWPADRALVFCDEAGDAQPIADALSNTDAKAWAILTGPEGGFDPAERELIRRSPRALPVTLGPRILRADTAALAALAVWQALKGDWG